MFNKITKILNIISEKNHKIGKAYCYLVEFPTKTSCKNKVYFASVGSWLVIKV